MTNQKFLTRKSQRLLNPVDYSSYSPWGGSSFSPKSIGTADTIQYETKLRLSGVHKRAIFGLFYAITATFFLLASNPALASEINLDAIKSIESSGNPFAVSFKGAQNGLGLYQISDIARRDFNNMTGSNVKTLDLLNPATNKKIAHWYLEKRIPQLLRHYGYLDTTENKLIAYNCGIGCLKRPSIPSETKNYIKKYQSMVGYDKG